MDFLPLGYWADLLRQGISSAYHQYGTPFTVLLAVAGGFVCWWILSLRR